MSIDLSNFSVSVNEAEMKEMKDSSGFQPITDSGIYEATIEYTSYSISKNGALAVDISLKTSDGKQSTIYGMYIKSKDGTELFGMKKFKSLLAVTGVNTVGAPTPTTRKFGDKEVTLNLIDELTDQNVIVKIVKEYSLYNGKVKSRLLLDKFYNPDTKQTASEMANGKEATQYFKDIENVKDRYRDGLSPDMVNAINNKEQNTTTNTTASTSVFG